MVLAILAIWFKLFAVDCFLPKDIELTVEDEKQALDDDDKRFEAIADEIYRVCHDEWLNYYAAKEIYDFSVDRRERVERILEHPEYSFTGQQFKFTLLRAHREASGNIYGVEQAINNLKCDEFRTDLKYYLMRDFKRILSDREKMLDEDRLWMSSTLKLCRDDPNLWDFDCTNEVYVPTRARGDYRLPIYEYGY